MCLDYCQEFLAYCSPICLWGDLANKIVMDIGCGKGHISTRCFMEKFPNIRKLIGIDHNLDIVNSAQRECNHPKIEYHQADILKWSSLSKWKDEIHAVISYYCFNCLDDKIQAFKNVYKLLKPGGTAAVLFTLQAVLYDCGKEVGEMYSEYATNCTVEPPESHTNNLSADSYKRDIAEIGFDVLLCNETLYSVTYRSDEEFKDYLTKSCAMKEFIPDELKPKFQDDIYRIYLKHNPRNEYGLNYIKFRAAKILVRKGK